MCVCVCVCMCVCDHTCMYAVCMSLLSNKGLWGGSIKLIISSYLSLVVFSVISRSQKHRHKYFWLVLSTDHRFTSGKQQENSRRF